MKRVCWSLILCSLSLWSSETVTIEHLIEATLQKHPSIKSAQLAIAGSDAAIDGARWNYYPTPNLSFDQGGGRSSTTLNLKQPLWTGGKIDSALNIAKADKRVSTSDLSQVRYTLALKCIELYATLIQSHGRIVVINETQSRLEGYDEMIQRRIDGGVSPLSDHELIANRIAQLKNELINIHTTQRTALAQINLISGLEIDPKVLIIDENMIKESYEQILNEALSSYPSLSKFTAQIKSAQYEIDKSNSQLYPTVSAVAERQIGSLYQENYADTRFYLSVSMSTGAGLSSFSQIEVARHKMESLIQNAEAEKIDLAQKIQSDYQTLHLMNQRLLSAEQAINASRNVLESYNRLFIAGKRNWLDVINAAREFSENQKTKNDMLAALFISNERLRLYRGTLVATLGDN